MKKVILLGATGSIGSSTIDVITSRPDDFQLVGMSAHSDHDGLIALGKCFPFAKLAISSRKTDDPLIHFSGFGAVLDLIKNTEADIVVNGIAGSAGLRPSMAALEAGYDLALANKETIVMAGPLIMDYARQKNRKIIPVDSEHSAIFHLLEAHGSDTTDELVLTASGGPFRHLSKAELEQVTVEQALAHPTWKMGGKITIDSASLANKGLEVIEAVRLFHFDAEKVTVVVHPQSRIHSLIRLKDGSLYAQLSNPDMRVPIHNALYYPECTRCDFGRLDLEGLTMTFEKPDTEKFPMLPLAYIAATRGALYPMAYNAANEVAVAAFFDGKIYFTQIPAIVKDVLDSDWSTSDGELDLILEGDRRARSLADTFIRGALQ